jgi:hypothetical protein
LEIKQASEGFHHVPGIVEAKVDSIREVWSVLQAGSNARAVGSNNVNEHSSRSHWYQVLLLFLIVHDHGNFYFKLLHVFSLLIGHTFQHALYYGKSKELDEWGVHQKQAMACRFGRQ